MRPISTGFASVGGMHDQICIKCRDRDFKWNRARLTDKQLIALNNRNKQRTDFYNLMREHYEVNTDFIDGYKKTLRDSRASDPNIAWALAALSRIMFWKLPHDYQCMFCGTVSSNPSCQCKQRLNAINAWDERLNVWVKQCSQLRLTNLIVPHFLGCKCSCIRCQTEPWCTKTYEFVVRGVLYIICVPACVCLHLGLHSEVNSRSCAADIIGKISGRKLMSLGGLKRIEGRGRFSVQEVRDKLIPCIDDDRTENAYYCLRDVAAIAKPYPQCYICNRPIKRQMATELHRIADLTRRRDILWCSDDCLIKLRAELRTNDGHRDKEWEDSDDFVGGLEILLRDVE
jgi:hypothetical protein